MRKLLKNKKGINDVYFIAVILAIYLISAVSITFLDSEFDVNSDNFDTDKTLQDVQDETSSIGLLNAGQVFLTIIKLATWDVTGSLNLSGFSGTLIQTFFTFLAVIWAILVYRAIRSGSG